MSAPKSRERAIDCRCTTLERCWRRAKSSILATTETKRSNSHSAKEWSSKDGIRCVFFINVDLRELQSGDASIECIIQGLVGMCVGEQRRLKIPSDLAYGSSGAGAKIPPNAALVFEVELLAIKREGEL